MDRACGSRTGRRVATSTRTWRLRRGSRPARTVSTSNSRSTSPTRATPTSPTRHACRRPCTRRRDCSNRASWRAAHWATQSSTTTAMRPGWRSPPSTARSPTGSASVRSSACRSDAPVTTSYDVINPATEQAVTTVPQLDAADTDAAIGRARRAAESWRDVAPGARAGLLRRFAAAVDDAREELARLEVANSGHTISNARWEAGNVRDVLDYYSGAPERLSGRQIPVAGGLNVTFHEPLGVVGVIVPWNFPMPIAGW